MKFFYRDDDELDIIRRVQPGEKILVFVNTIAKLRKLRDTLKADGIVDVACLCSKYRQEARNLTNWMMCSWAMFCSIGHTDHNDPL